MCEVPNSMNSIEEPKEVSNIDECTICKCNSHNEIVKLKLLCKDLLIAADKCGKKPYYIVQPFFSIVREHLDTIKEYDLM